MVGHDLHLNHHLAVRFLFFDDQFFEASIDRRNEHFVSVLRAKDDGVLTTGNDRAVPMVFGREHADILSIERMFFQPCQGQSPQQANLSPLYPTAKTGGFYGVIHKKSPASTRRSFFHMLVYTWGKLESRSIQRLRKNQDIALTTKNAGLTGLSRHSSTPAL